MSISVLKSGKFETNLSKTIFDILVILGGLLMWYVNLLLSINYVTSLPCVVLRSVFRSPQMMIWGLYGL